MGNREDTTDRILNAALEILAAEGFAALGINPIARRAEADKQLIYRYFGGLEGLLQALGRKVAGRLTAALGGEALPTDPAIEPPAVAPPTAGTALATGANHPRPPSYAGLMEHLLIALYRFMVADAQYRQLRVMEVAAPSAATEAFRAARGEAIRDWLKLRAAGLAPPPGRDVFALNAALVAAVEGLAVLGGAGLTGPEVQARQEAALRALLHGVYGTRADGTGG